MENVELAVPDILRSDWYQVILPHLNPVGKPNDIEPILGSEVMEDCDKGLPGLGKDKT
jgi:hypothetical protein